MRDPHAPLRILHLTAGSDAGGLSRYIHDLGTAMVAQGHQVTVAGERGAWHWLFERSALPWIDVPLKGGPIALWQAASTLRRWMQKNPVDILHTHYRRPTLVARWLQRSFKIPVLYTVHLSDLALHWPWSLFSDFGDHTHVASREAKRWVIEDGHVPGDQVSLIHHGIEVSKFPLADEDTRRAARAALRLPQDTRVAAFVGRFDYPKNEEWLLDVAERMPKLHVLYAGEGPHEPALRQRSGASIELAERVNLLGHRDPLVVYQAADALLLPSIREGFSLVCAEAMSVGTPCLRTKTAGTEELIQENVTGRSVAINHRAFVDAAVEFLSLPTEQLRRMGAAASQHVGANFTYDKQLERTIALYHRLTTTGAPAA
jgi:glycosyltransferase involved in cell wall biosynthesis